MINNIDNLTSFGYSILTGILAALIYDSFRAFRYIHEPRKAFKYIGDIIFWIIITNLFFLTVLKLSDGVLRGFLFIGFFSGGILYLLTLSRLMYKLFIKIFSLIIQLFNEIIEVIKFLFMKLKINNRLKKILEMSKESKTERKKHWKTIRKNK